MLAVDRGDKGSERETFCKTRRKGVGEVRKEEPSAKLVR